MSTDHEPPIFGTAICTKCGKEKPALAFGAARRKKNGLASWCRECSNRSSSNHNGMRRVREALMAGVLTKDEG